MGGPVDDDMSNLIVAQLLYLDSVAPNKDITMYVNSPGGSVTAGKDLFQCFSCHYTRRSAISGKPKIPHSIGIPERSSCSSSHALKAIVAVKHSAGWNGRPKASPADPKLQ